MGIINNFVGGMGGAMADIGKMAFADSLQRDRDEVRWKRDQILAGQKSEAEKERLGTISAEAQLASDDRRYAVDQKPPKNPQIVSTNIDGLPVDGILGTDAQGNPTVTVPSVAGGPAEEFVGTKDRLKLAEAQLKKEGKGSGLLGGPTDEEILVRAHENWLADKGRGSGKSGGGIVNNVSGSGKTSPASKGKKYTYEEALKMATDANPDANIEDIKKELAKRGYTPD